MLSVLGKEGYRVFLEAVLMNLRGWTIGLGHELYSHKADQEEAREEIATTKEHDLGAGKTHGRHSTSPNKDSNWAWVNLGCGEWCQEPGSGCERKIWHLGENRGFPLAFEVEER